MMTTISIILLAIVIALLLFIYINRRKLPVSPVPGTDTVFVGIFVDKNQKIGTTPGEEILHPGQKVIFSSANKFEIKFKNGKSPVEETELFSTDGGVLILKIPKGIFKDERFMEEFKANKELVFDYDIKVGDLTLDPPMRIIPK